MSKVKISAPKPTLDGQTVNGKKTNLLPLVDPKKVNEALKKPRKK